MIRPPPRSPLFPSAPLFRSQVVLRAIAHALSDHQPAERHGAWPDADNRQTVARHPPQTEGELRGEHGHVGLEQALGKDPHRAYTREPSQKRVGLCQLPVLDEHRDVRSTGFCQQCSQLARKRRRPATLDQGNLVLIRLTREVVGQSQRAIEVARYRGCQVARYTHITTIVAWSWRVSPEQGLCCSRGGVPCRRGTP